MSENMHQNALKKSIKGLGFMEETKRIYPNNSLGAHVLGFVGDYNQGLGGLEYLYEKELKGNSGKMILEGDPRGRQMITGYREVEEPQHGVNIITTLDYFLQHRAQSILQQQIDRYLAERGSVIILDVRNGEVIAMANSPSFNPNSWQKQPIWSTLRNSSVSDMYEPGSTFKVLTIAAAINENIVEADTVITVPEQIFRYRRKIREAHKRKDGESDQKTVHEILRDSLNVGTTLIAEKLGEKMFFKYMQDFGMGKLTGIEAPGEAKGILRPLKNWSGVDLAMHSFGQAVAVTPIQLAMAIGAIANEGTLLKPKVVRYLSFWENMTIQAIPKTKIRQVVAPKTARQILSIMTDVVDNGTAQIVKIPGYSIAGKTGTAQKPKANALGYEKDKYISSFVGVFPASQPQFLILVMIDSPQEKYYGSTVAGPVFRELALDMISRYNIPPDRKPYPNVLKRRPIQKRPIVKND